MLPFFGVSAGRNYSALLSTDSNILHAKNKKKKKGRNVNLLEDKEGI